MSIITLNGLDVCEAIIAIPRHGNWRVDAMVDQPGADSITSGEAASIVLGTQQQITLIGTAYRGGYHHDTRWMRIVGGAGGLGSDTTPRMYSDATARIILSDMLGAAGETLDDASDSSLTGLSLPFWTIMRQTVRDQLDALLVAMGGDTAIWRMTVEGKVWFGTDTWLETTLQHDEIEVSPREGKITLGFEEPILLPGCMVSGFKVGYVEHRIKADEILTDIWIES